MKIGMAGSSMLLAPWREALAAAAEHGFEAFEIFGEFPQCICGEVSAGERAEARAFAAASGVKIAVHAPFHSVNIAALNPGIRRESIQQQKEAVDLCADLGGEAVILHTGEYVVSERIRREVPGAEKLQWELNVAALKEIAAYAADRGVTVCLENIGFEPEHLDQNIEDLLRLRAEVNESSLAFCLDVGHARLNRELGEAITRLGPLAHHLHFTDNFGERDDHLIIGEGNFDYSPWLDFFRSFPHIITLEVVNVGRSAQAAVKSRQNFFRLIQGEA